MDTKRAEKLGIPPRESEITMSDIATLIGSLASDTTKRLGRIERNQITSEQANRKINPEYDNAVKDVIAENKK